MIQRDKLEEHITNKIRNDILIKRKTLQETTNKIYEEYEIPIEIVTDILSLKQSIKIYDEFILYAVGTVLLGDLSHWFSKKEIAFFKDKKYEKVEFGFPFSIKMIEVRPDQWIGVTTVSQLMQLRDAQLIHYNENTQRIMRRIKRGEIEYHSIYVNEKAVEEIKKSFAQGSYIPNTLTFNLPADSDFDYNPEKCQLTINSMKYMDILDGYHRYRGAMEQRNANPDFDYPMEIRIVCFTAETARFFIYQEDQKTPMKKVDSNLYNVNDPSVKVVEAINSDPTFLLKGKITTGADMIVNPSYLAFCIKNITLRDKSPNRSIILMEKNKLVKYINSFLEENEEWINKRWTWGLILSVVMCSENNYTDTKTILKFAHEIDNNNNTKYQLGSRRITDNRFEEFQKTLKDIGG